MKKNSLKSQAFKLKGRLYTLTVMQMLRHDLTGIKAQVETIVKQAPKMFDNTPVILDFSDSTDPNTSLADVCEIFKAQGILPVAIQGGCDDLERQAKDLALGILHGSPSHDKTVGKSEKQQPKNALSKTVTSPVRSGQQVVSQTSDLIVLSSVSHGAELLAEGHIHVYGALRGRALAGISGNKEARIFCHSLEADLVSIAGFYLLSDAMESQKGPCQIYLEDEHLKIDPL